MAETELGIRPSLDGHSFHHAWAARSALELIAFNSDLTALAMEGFSREDESLGLDRAAVEVADLVRYRGGFDAVSSDAVEVVQFKYSVARAQTGMRVSDATKTLRKFAATDKGFADALGSEVRDARVRYELITNRPIHEALVAAVEALRSGTSCAGDALVQAQEIESVCSLTGDALKSFLGRVSLIGAQGSLRAVRATGRQLVASWSPASDALARTHFLRLERLATDKAGSMGQSDPLIRRMDVLAELDVADEADLFPAQAAFPAIGSAVAREATALLVTKILEARKPLLLHAPGGAGKTVLMQSAAERLADDHLIVLFDGFGAGRWRDPADGRHRPDKALMQIANQLAAQGHCDPILPSMAASVDIAATFRRRMAQAVASLASQGMAGGVILMLDAIDHAAERARDTGQESFGQLLLETFSITPLPGVRLIGSCRTERLPLTQGGADCETWAAPLFTRPEAYALVRARHPVCAQADLEAAFTRTGGNPRLLSLLTARDPPFERPQDLPGEPPEPMMVAELIGNQVAEARLNAGSRGANSADLDALLAGLAYLPPAVPITELAAAQGLQESAIQGFVADLFPLIEHSPQGLIFRDEPTEDFVRDWAASQPTAQTAMVERLQDRQDVSSYAARALPGVLRELKRSEALYALAWEDRFPIGVTSTVAQRAIRLARLQGALALAAVENNHDQLFRLTLELARLAGGHGRSDGYLRDYPDLVAFGGEPESLRRFFEDRSGWYGAKASAMAIAQLFLNEEDEAKRHAQSAIDWDIWRDGRDPDDSRSLPRRTALDIIGPAWVAIALGRFRDAAAWIADRPSREVFLLTGQ